MGDVPKPRSPSMCHNRRHAFPRVSDYFVMQDVATETCYLHVSILHTGASWMRLSHIVCFLQVAWPIIRPDFIKVFDALWHMDTRSLHAINQALLILLHKDFMPISLIHILGKLLSKVLANQLAPRLGELVHISQSAFIKRSLIHNNFRFIQLAGPGRSS
jgi:hypothetical protein